MSLFNYLGAFILASEIPFANDSSPRKWNLLVDVAAIAGGRFRVHQYFVYSKHRGQNSSSSPSYKLTFRSSFSLVVLFFPE